MDAPTPSAEPGALCPVCGHREDLHRYWSADLTCGGWAHCTVGRGHEACPCWRDWPQLT